MSFHLFAAGTIVGAYLHGESLTDPWSNIHLRELERYHDVAQEQNALITVKLGWSAMTDGSAIDGGGYRP